MLLYQVIQNSQPREQIEELLNNTTSVWTTQNGVEGRKFTGPNGGTIFLPAAGYLERPNAYTTWWEYTGERGYYLSSTPYYSDYSSAYVLRFTAGGAGLYSLECNVAKMPTARRVRKKTE